MKNPAGVECKYFYGNYFRGRNDEECRLVGNAWKRNLCQSCPVPGILRANACETMQLEGEVTRSLGSLFQKRVEIHAHCRKTGIKGFDPNIGCGECHPIPDVFKKTN
jgi:hypothetical protein